MNKELINNIAEVRELRKKDGVYTKEQIKEINETKERLEVEYKTEFFNIKRDVMYVKLGLQEQGEYISFNDMVETLRQFIVVAVEEKLISGFECKDELENSMYAKIKQLSNLESNRFKTHVKKGIQKYLVKIGASVDKYKFEEYKGIYATDKELKSAIKADERNEEMDVDFTAIINMKHKLINSRLYPDAVLMMVNADEELFNMSIISTLIDEIIAKFVKVFNPKFKFEPSALCGKYVVENRDEKLEEYRQMYSRVTEKLGTKRIYNIEDTYRRFMHLENEKDGNKKGYITLAELSLNVLELMMIQSMKSEFTEEEFNEMVTDAKYVTVNGLVVAGLATSDNSGTYKIRGIKNKDFKIEVIQEYYDNEKITNKIDPMRLHNYKIKFTSDYDNAFYRIVELFEEADMKKILNEYEDMQVENIHLKKRR